jgi:hypothetical protein
MSGDDKMKTYRGIVKGNTIVLEQTPDLPVECPAEVAITPLVHPPREQELVRRQVERLAHPHKGGTLRYRRREELYAR